MTESLRLALRREPLSKNLFNREKIRGNLLNHGYSKLDL